MRIKIYIFALLFVFPFLCFGQATIYSNYNSGNDATGNGSSNSPYKTFHKAYIEASSGDIIDLTGTFDWTNADEIGDVLASGYTINKSITIQGQDASSTFIQSASSEGIADRRVLSLATGNVITISNVTIRYGVATTGGFHSGGGGIESEAELTIQNCIITRNRATSIYASGGGACLIGGTFPIIVDDCIFSYNQNTASSYGYGGALSIESPNHINTILKNSTFHNNSTTSRGSALIVYGSWNAEKPHIYNCTFTNNSGGTYGTVWLDRKGCYVTNNTVSNNTSGGINVYGDNHYFKNNISVNNSSYDFYQWHSTTVHDNGYNIIGSATGNSVSWSDNTTIGVPVNMNLSTTLAGNNSLNISTTLALQTGSAAIDAGSSTANGDRDVPAIDQRGMSRNGTTDIGAYEYNGTAPVSDITWDGSSSSDWNTGANWDGNSVPTSGDDVIIADAGNVPTIASGVQADCNNLTINADATLILASGGSLITTGTITNNGTFNVERSISNGQWHLISSPVSNAVSGMFTGYFLQSWSEEDAWWYEVTDNNTILTPLKGYGFWSNGSGSSTHSYSGNPNTGDQNISLTTVGSGGTYNKANLVGNPYPSSIDWSGLDDTYGAVNYYNGTGYVSWNDGVGSGSQYIPPTQGFFIVPSASGTLSLDDNDRTHTNATGYYKSLNSITNGIVIAASNQLYEDDLWIKFSQNASNGFDFNFDAHKFMSNVEGTAQLYSKYEDINLSIDVRPEINTIQVGFKNDKAGNYSILLKQIDGVSSIELEDTKLNTFHDLIDGPYHFDWETTDSEERFVLHINVTGIDDIEEDNIQVYTANGNVYVSLEEVDEYDEIRIYDLSGRLVLENQLSNQNLQSFDLNYLQGAYLVQLKGKRKVKSKKVIL